MAKKNTWFWAAVAALVISALFLGWSGARTVQNDDVASLELENLKGVCWENSPFSVAAMSYDDKEAYLDVYSRPVNSYLSEEEQAALGVKRGTVYDYSEGIALGFDADAGEYVAFDQEGRKLFRIDGKFPERSWNYVSDMFFCKGVAAIHFGDGTSTFIDQDGNFLLEPFNGSVTMCTNGTALFAMQSPLSNETYFGIIKLGEGVLDVGR